MVDSRRASAEASWSLRAAAVLLLLTVSRAEAATLHVNAGGDLQAALNAAKPGDHIVLQAGATFVGNFRLPPKPSGAMITIRSSAALPSRRLTPADASLLPTLVSPTLEPALLGTAMANWKLDGLRFEPTQNGMNSIIVLQDATNVTMDRLLIVGGAQGQRRAVVANGQSITLARSHIANIWRTGEESQAFCAWDGAGPYTIRDNYLEAATQGILFGGANSGSPSRVPSNIRIENNHVSKRLSWKGQPRVVKNLMELRSVRRVVVRNNVFEGNWPDAQHGYAIRFTVENEGGGSPWSVVEDVLFEQNIVRETENGIYVQGYDSQQPSGRTTGITIRQNLIIAAGTFLLIGGEAGDLRLDHNTVEQGHTFAILNTGLVWEAGTAAPRRARFAAESLTVTNTLGNHGAYGLIGEDGSIGTSALRQLTAAYRWTHNVLAGESGWSQTYPLITWQPGAADHRAQFASTYALTATSAYRNAANDGQDLGISLPGRAAARSTGVCGDRIANGRDGSVDQVCPNDVPDEVCGDGIDNNGNTLIDEGCPAAAAEICGDTIDNTGDGLIDEGCPVAPAETAGPTVTLWNVVQTRSHLKFRVEATDPSGISGVRVEFKGSLVTTATSAPVNVMIPLQKLGSGVHALQVTVTDALGNATIVSQTIMR